MSDARHSLRLAFYGDDFTGSTDALEVLAFAGMQTALLLKPPTPEVLAHFPKLDAVGVAGDSRAMTPAEMDAHLPQVFAALRSCITRCARLSTARRASAASAARWN